MLSCFGIGKNREDAEREPLLPRYNDDTGLQTRLHEKLHTYQMLRAISKGYMPSNEQLIIHLRTLLSAQILNPERQELSPSGRALIRSIKLWITQFIEVLQHKNGKDQIQDFIWYLTKARLDVDVAHIEQRAARAKVRADAVATYKSLQTVGSLLLTNSDFRIFLSDLSTVGKEILRDTAFTLSDVSKQAGEAIEPSKEEQEALKHANGNEKSPSDEDLKNEVVDVGETVKDGALEVADGAIQSIKEHAKGDEGDALVKRLKQTVLNLRKRTDYKESVSTIGLLLQRYLLAYSHAAAATVEAIEEDTQPNREADKAMHNFWLFITSLGKREHWDNVKKSFEAVVDDGKTDPNFDELVRQLGNLVQDMFSDPDFFDNIEERFQGLRKKSNELTAKSSIRDDLDELLSSLYAAFRSILDDQDIKKLIHTTERVALLLSPAGEYANSDLVTDTINIFVPLLIQAIQYIPIPRVEVSAPAIDLLIENLILEPGRTINASSFLPFQLNVSTYNEVQVKKALHGTQSSMTSMMKVTVSGLSIAAEDLGFWFRLHSGLLRMVDEGIAGFHLDKRGVDITLDIEIGKDRMEQIVSLRNVNVHIHHLNYTLRKSKFACLAWLLKPLIRPIVRKALEIKIAAAIAEGLHFLNREMLYARERLRATRIADPKDLWTFIRAVAARLVPAPDPDIEARVGVKAGKGVFQGRYAPGSLVKLWETEGRDAEQKLFEYDQGGWKNDIFDVSTVRA
ncbi:bactericidal permeability-increasing protein [Fusarium avenaceum]|nr:bactericidal permeability-increasing protein [Fusarium avenaceum]